MREGREIRFRGCCFFGSEFWVGIDGGSFYEVFGCSGVGEDIMKGGRRIEYLDGVWRGMFLYLL